MDKNKLEEYAVLTAQIKYLKNKIDVLKVDIISGLVKTDDATAVTSMGKFTITNLKTWTYTEKAKQLGEDFKARKAIEESTGDATYIEKPSLRFTEIKI